MTQAAPAHRPSARQHMVDSALALARNGEVLSLDSAARAAGVTKPGLMYHFSTKEALMTALVDQAMDEVENDLVARVPDRVTGVDEVRVEDRLLAYLDWACTTDFEVGDLLMFIDPKLREPLTLRWAERIEPWLAIPAAVPPARRSRLLTARLAADGVWFGIASGGVPLTNADRLAVLDLARTLILEDR